MSFRDTPRKGSMARNGSVSLFSPADSNSSLPTIDPSSPSKRRALGSLAMRSMPGSELRRPSDHLGSRKASQVTISGTSTPDYAKRRAIKEAQATQAGETVSEADWANIEPDEIFAKLPVNEVKRIETRMRADALNKQSELRSMVGTRYRDLLTSATQITSLRDSSLHLSSSLRAVAKSCTDPTDLTVTTEADTTESTDGEDVMSMLPVAAHMKLLLDAPEALYSYLAHENYLRAAHLWLVTRVVKESLAGMPEDVNGAYTSLLQRQWDVLQPFRTQIVQRATASLRRQEEVDAKIVCETLLAIILLDNLPTAEALDLFLSQRLKAVRDSLAHPEQGRSAIVDGHLGSPLHRRDSAGSSSKPAQIDIGNILIQAVKTISNTGSLCRQALEKRRKATSSESMLEEMIRLIQLGEPAPIRDPASKTTLTHNRRASRLASMSLPLPKLSFSSTGPPVSVTRVIQDLPASQILLAHLPPSIVGFTPFIATSELSDLDHRLKGWQTSAIRILTEQVPSWLASLNNVSDIWKLRKRLIQSQQGAEVETAITTALEGQWSQRIKQVWTSKLSNLLAESEVKVREACRQIKAVGDEYDIEAEIFAFGDLPFPAPPTNALTASATPLNNFLAAVQKRMAFRTPLLDSILTSMETAALDIKTDLEGLPGSLYDSYADDASAHLTGLVTMLRKILDEALSDKSADYEAELLVGRTALFICKSSSFLQDLAAASAIDTSDAVRDLMTLHSSSVTRWRTSSVGEAAAELQGLFSAERGATEVQASWQGPYPVAPSSLVTVALQSLVGSTRELGIPPNMDLPVVRDLVVAFVDAARSIEGWSQAQEEANAQVALDLAFLDILVGEDFKQDTLVTSALSKLPSSIPPDFSDMLGDLVIDHLRRTQVLFNPLLRHLDLQAMGIQVSKSASKNGLLRFGPPKASSGITTDFRSPLAIAKPGKRFGLLSIAA